MQGNIIGDTVPIVCPTCRSLMRANRKLLGHMIMCSACLGPVLVQEESDSNSSPSVPSAGEASKPAAPVSSHGEIMELAPDDNAGNSRTEIARGPAPATPKPGESVGKQPASSDEFPEVICPGCGEKLYTAKSNFGKTISCTACRAEFQVPNPSSSKFPWGKRDEYTVATRQAEGNESRPGGVKNSAPPTSQKPAASEPAKSAPWDAEADDDVDDLLKYLSEGTADSAGKSNGESGGDSEHEANDLLDFLLSTDDESPSTDHSSQVTAATPPPSKKKVIALCPTCSARYFVSSRKENKQIQCQKCGTPFFVRPSETNAPQVSSARDDALPSHPADPFAGTQSPFARALPPNANDRFVPQLPLKIPELPAVLPSINTASDTEKQKKKKKKKKADLRRGGYAPSMRVGDIFNFAMSGPGYDVASGLVKFTLGLAVVLFVVGLILALTANREIFVLVLIGGSVLSVLVHCSVFFGIVRSSLESEEGKEYLDTGISLMDLPRAIGAVGLSFISVYFLASLQGAFGPFPVRAAMDFYRETGVFPNRASAPFLLVSTIFTFFSIFGLFCLCFSGAQVGVSMPKLVFASLYLRMFDWVQFVWKFLLGLIMSAVALFCIYFGAGLLALVLAKVSKQISGEAANAEVGIRLVFFCVAIGVLFTQSVFFVYFARLVGVLGARILHAPLPKSMFSDDDEEEDPWSAGHRK